MKKLLVVMLALSVVSLQAGKHRKRSARTATEASTQTQPASSSSNPVDSSSTPSASASYLKSLRSTSVTWQRAVPAAVIVAALLAYMQNYTETVRSTEIDTAE